MKDLTRGSIANHIVTMAVPSMIFMLVQIAYQLIDLYFVTRISVAATAGINAVGNIGFIVSGVSQVLGVGSLALIANAVGRKDSTDANLVFNQSIGLTVTCSATMTISLYLLIKHLLRLVAADEEIVDAGATFFLWVLPTVFLLPLMSAAGSALRATGTVLPTVAAFMLILVLNAILAPILIGGWITHRPLGIRGAGLATSISAIVGALALGMYLHYSQRYLVFDRRLVIPKLNQWRRIVAVGLPAGGEFALMFLSGAVVYYAIRNFGSTSQAGYGVGARILQILLIPGMAVALAAGPIAAQNLGARNNARVVETFRTVASIATAVMLLTSLLAQWALEPALRFFGADAISGTVGMSFLRVMSWAFVAQGVVYTCTGMFQGLGNTMPSLISSCSAFIAFSASAAWLIMQPVFPIEYVWYALAASIVLQSLVSLLLLRAESRRRLPSTHNQAPAIC